MFAWTIGALSAVPAWIGLLFGRHGFWRAEPRPDHLNGRADAPTFLLVIVADSTHDLANLSAHLKKMVNERRDPMSVTVRFRNQSFCAVVTIDFVRRHRLGRAEMERGASTAVERCPTT